MAEYNLKTGNIDLSEEDKEMFRNVGRNMSAGKTPWAQSIMKAIIPQNLQDSFNIPKHE